MLSSYDIAQIGNVALKLGIITSEDSRFLTQYSAFKTVDSFLSSDKEKHFSIILSKIASDDSLDCLRSEIDSAIVDNLLTSYKDLPIDTYEFYEQHEAETGLIACSVSKKNLVNFSEHEDDSSIFFTIKEIGDTIDVSFNRNHIFHQKLSELKECKAGYQLFQDLFHAWALYEMDFHSDSETDHLVKDRDLWGRKLRDLLRGKNGK